jgi:hypothetical protein
MVQLHGSFADHAEPRKDGLHSIVKYDIPYSVGPISKRNLLVKDLVQSLY